MTCHHRSIRQPLTGNEDTCILCRLEIIFDGKRWVWKYGLDATKRRKLTTAYNVDRITGAHA